MFCFTPEGGEHVQSQPQYDLGPSRTYLSQQVPSPNPAPAAAGHGLAIFTANIQYSVESFGTLIPPIGTLPIAWQGLGEQRKKTGSRQAASCRHVIREAVILLYSGSVLKVPTP